MANGAKCPPECELRLDTYKDDIDKLEEAMGKRAKISTLIALAVIAVGILSGLLSTLYVQASRIDRKLDVVTGHQIQVMTVLGLEPIKVPTAESNRSHSK